MLKHATLIVTISTIAPLLIHFHANGEPPSRENTGSQREASEPGRGRSPGDIHVVNDSSAVSHASETSEIEKLVAEFDRERVVPNSVTVSPDLRRVAFWMRVGGQKAMVLDGKRGEAFGNLVMDEAIFSADSRRVAYAAGDGGAGCYVIDGNKTSYYEKVNGGIAFSPDSKLVAYAALLGDNWSVFMNGVRGKEYDSVWRNSLTFSPDSKRIAYVASSKDETFVVLDGVEHKRYDRIESLPRFSPNGKRLAYTGSRNGTHHVVVDGRELDAYDFVHNLVFSPDSKQVAYVGRIGKSVEPGETEEFLVVNGEMYGPYTSILAPTFSPDSTRLGFRACQGETWVMVVDGETSEPYDSVKGLVFSPNSKRFAYRAKTGDDIVVIVDGEEKARHVEIPVGGFIGFTLIQTQGPVFSPDSKRVAYVDYRDGKCIVVVDGRPRKPYDDIGEGTLMFSPDSRRVAYVAKVGDSECVVLDEEEGVRYRNVPGLVFESVNVLRYLAVQDGYIYSVERTRAK